MSEPAPPDAPPAGERPASVEALEPRCANCGAALFGAFCAQCGQEVRSPDPSARELFREGWEEFTSVDGKLLRTVRMLVTAPGALTLEYFAGRRASYVSPLKLYLWLSVLYFFVAAMVPDRRPPVTWTGSVWTDEERAARARTTDSLLALAPTAERRAVLRDSLQQVLVRDSVAAMARTMVGLDSAAIGIRADTTRNAASRSLGAALKRAAAHPEEFQRTAATWVPRAIFALVPVVGLLLGAVYRSRRLRYPRHLAFALHLHAFVFALLLVFETLGAATSGIVLDVGGMLAVGIGLPVYGVLAMRRVYGGRMAPTIGRAALLLALYLPLFAVAMGLAMVAALLTF